MNTYKHGTAAYWHYEYVSAKAAYENEYKKCWDVCEAAAVYVRLVRTAGRKCAKARNAARKALLSAIERGLAV